MRENYIDFENEMNELLSKRNFLEIRELMNETPPADAAEYLEQQPVVTVLKLMKVLPKDMMADVFSYFEPEMQDFTCYFSRFLPAAAREHCAPQQ